MTYGPGVGGESPGGKNKGQAGVEDKTCGQHNGNGPRRRWDEAARVTAATHKIADDAAQSSTRASLLLPPPGPASESTAVETYPITSQRHDGAPPQRIRQGQRRPGRKAMARRLPRRREDRRPPPAAQRPNGTKGRGRQGPKVVDGKTTRSRHRGQDCRPAAVCGCATSLEDRRTPRPGCRRKVGGSGAWCKSGRHVLSPGISLSYLRRSPDMGGHGPARHLLGRLVWFALPVLAPGPRRSVSRPRSHLLSC